MVIVVRDFPGFIVNYLQYPFRLNAIRMLERGLATREDIDAAAALGLGHPMGPLALQDLVGLDVTLAGAGAVYQATGDPAFKPPVLMQKMVAAGLLGRKTGKGFDDYEDK
jgi:3-hydroxybutyryl-CoA dehydrogenase